MFMACGAGAFAAAIFHVVTHAFFKALLFLGAGSVIHGLHGEQDLMRMGALRRAMPVTAVTFLLGSLALAGFPLTSGFFSKDEILWETVSGAPSFPRLLWAIGAATSLLTAFYTARLFALAFLGTPRFDAAHVHPHESPPVMTLPLVVLAVGAVFAGWLGIPHVFAHDANWIGRFLAPSLAAARSLHAGGEGHAPAGEGFFMAVSSVIAITGLAAGALLYARGPERGEALLARTGPVYGLLAGKYWVDEIYEVLVLRPLGALASLAARFDLQVVDGLVNLTGRAFAGIGRTVNRLQDGHLQTYGIWIAGGAVGLVAIVLYQLW
jgi:NADH-quinone oxidoreductase subunit L